MSFGPEKTLKLKRKEWLYTAIITLIIIAATIFFTHEAMKDNTANTEVKSQK